MLNTLQISDFSLRLLKGQTENFEISENDLNKQDHLKNPLLKMGIDIRLQLRRHLFLKNQLVLNHIKPP